MVLPEREEIRMSEIKKINEETHEWIKDLKDKIQENAENIVERIMMSE